MRNLTVRFSRNTVAGILSAGLAVSSLTACREKQKPPEPAPVALPPPSGGSRPNPTAQGSASPTAAPSASPREAALSAIERDMTSSDPEVYLKTLTDLLNGWVMSKNSFPTNLDVFVKEKMIRRLPTPPAGKQLAIDRKAMRVVLADK